MSDAYRIRPYEPSDEDRVRALYETVSGHGPDPEWFEWKFARSPFAEDVPMFVAEHGNDIVGIRPYQVVPLSAGGTALRAGYFQNMSMPPPTISTPKPTARFQSPIGRGSCPAVM